MKTKILCGLLLFTFSITFSQDNCNTALLITAGEYTVTSINGTEIPNPICTTGGNNANSGEWYRYIPNEDLNLTVTTDLSVNAGGDTRFHVYTGNCSGLVCFAGDDDEGAGFLSIDSFNVTSGTTYYIAFDNNWSSDGFIFQLIEDDLVEPPPPPPVTFTTQTISTSGSNRAVVDMNGDFLDDIVSITATNVNIQFQVSGGGFTERNISTLPADFLPTWSLAAGDFDANGYNDLLYGNGSGVTFMKAKIEENNIDNGDDFDDVVDFSEISGSQYVFSQRSNFVDINNDGHLDAFVCHDVDANVFYINDGLGNLAFNQGGLGNITGNYGSIWIDYDNDRDLDMFIAKCGSGPINQMLTNDGNYNFTENATEIGLADAIQTWSSAWGDFDNDGDMDVFVGASSGSHKLMRNDNGIFTNVTIGSGISALTATSIETVTYDLDNDGNLDVISGGNILIGNGDLTFDVYENILSISGGSYGDLNNDGFIDAFNGGFIFMNDTNANNWVKIVTIGKSYDTPNRSNRNGIGARVEVHTSQGMQIRDVRSGEGFRYMSSLNTHFGLGAITTIDNIIIYWPSGVIDNISNPNINETITIVEGATLNIVNETLSDISIYPNPVDAILTITTSLDLSEKIATVFDINGKRVLNQKLNSNSLNVSTLSSGVYFLRLESEGKTLKRKFIKN